MLFPTILPIDRRNFGEVALEIFKSITQFISVSAEESLAEI